MLGIKKISPGRMGNRLFHYNFLRQVAQKTGIDYFHPELPDSVYFENMEKQAKPFQPFKKSIKLTSRDVLAFNKDDFLAFIIEETENGKNILFEPPMLGEVFFDYLFYSPNDFITIKDQYKVNFKFDPKNRIVIGAHFRGGDFAKWNKNALLKFSYYKDAILYCLDYFVDDTPIFLLFTDDIKFPAFLETVEFLKSLKGVDFYLGDSAELPIYDFYQMSQCDVLISSPSTFSIIAGSVGTKKKIIHAKSWLDYSIKRNDTFWVKLNKTSNSYYSLWKTF